MTRKNRRSATTLIAMLGMVVLSSCNRGYGCPTNFSVEDAFNILLQTASNLLF